MKTVYVPLQRPSEARKSLMVKLMAWWFRRTAAKIDKCAIKQVGYKGYKWHN